MKNKTLYMWMLKTFKSRLSLLLLVMLMEFLVGAGNVGAQLADSPWPMFGGGPLHTGLSQYTTGKDKIELIWSYKTGKSVESSPVIGADGAIYIGSHDGYLYAINPDGTLKWKFEVAKPIYDERWKGFKSIMATPAVDKNGTIYINGASNYLHAINPDGTEKWRFFIKWHNDFWNSPTVSDDDIIYIGTGRNDGDTSHPSGLYAITLDGTEKWRYLEPSGVTVIPAISNDTIYFGAAETTTNKGRVIALDKNGKKLWQYDMEQWLEGSASIAKDGTIYSGSKEGNVYAINPDGTEKWRFKTGSGISAVPAIGEDGAIYIGSWDGNFYALNPENGQEIWRFDVKIGRDPKLFEGYPGKETIISSAAISKNSIIYFGDVLDTLYVLNLNGKELWRYKGSSGYAASPAIGKEGRIYIGNEGGEVLAFGGPTAEEELKDLESEMNESSEEPITSEESTIEQTTEDSSFMYVVVTILIVIVVGVIILMKKWVSKV